MSIEDGRGCQGYIAGNENRLIVGTRRKIQMGYDLSGMDPTKIRTLTRAQMEEITEGARSRLKDSWGQITKYERAAAAAVQRPSTGIVTLSSIPSRSILDTTKVDYLTVAQFRAMSYEQFRTMTIGIFENLRKGWAQIFGY